MPPRPLTVGTTLHLKAVPGSTCPPVPLNLLAFHSPSLSSQKVLLVLCSARGQTVISWKRGLIEKSEKIDTFCTNFTVSPTVQIDIDQSSKGSEQGQKALCQS